MRESRQPNAIIAIVDETPAGCAGRRPLLLRFGWRRTTVGAMLGSCLAYLLLGAAAVHALDPSKRITQYTHTSWRIREGAALANGYAITQTSDGFLWFVTGDMSTFDGVRFASWDGPPNYGSISRHDTGFGQIVNAFGDRSGGLWVFGLRSIVQLKGRVVTSHFELDGIRNVQSVSEDSDGSLWVVRGNNNVSDEPLCHVTEQAVKCFGKADGIPICPLSSILADGKGGLWLGGQTTLVHWHDGVSETYPIEGLKSNGGQTGIAALARGPDGSLWVGIRPTGPGRGLGRLINGVFQPFRTPSFDGTAVGLRSMIFDRDGNLWIGTNGQGMFRIRGNSVEHYGRTEGLASDLVNAVFGDREGVLWAAGPLGVDSFRDPPVASFSSSEGLANDRPMGVLASRDGTIWVANTGSLNHIDKNGTISSIRPRDGLPGTQVSSMLEDRAGNMWVGVDDGLYLFKNGHFHRLREPNHKPLGLVVGLAEDTDGNIWAECAGNPRKLVRIRDFQILEEFAGSQVPNGRTLASGPAGGIWIGTLDGDLAFFHHGAVDKFPLSTKGDRFIRQIIANTDGSVLAASAEGLVGVRQGKVQRMTTRNGLPCNFVTSFIQDKEKRWWLYTDCGIVELPDSELQRWWANPEMIVQIRVYDELDGAQAGRPDFNSAALSSDGRVWFASGVWIQMVDPSRLAQKALPAVAYVESVTANRKEVTATNNPKLPPNLRDLQIDYTSPAFLIPQKVKFRYRLDPYDRDWKEAGTRRQAFYTNLPPGKYSFRVIACNSDGVWNESAAKLDFSVTPAYYQTNWFRALCVAFVLALAWAAYQLRTRQLQRDFKKLRDVIETIPAIVFEVGPDGSGAFGNQRWLEYAGSSLRQYGKFAPEDQAWRDSTCIHPDDLDGYVSLWERAIATGQPFELETRVRRADGEYRWFLARHVPLRDVQGRILKWFGTLTDIEDRKRAEKALRASEAYLAESQRLTHTGTWVGDPTTAPLYWSEELFRIFGFDPQHGLPTKDQPPQRIHPEDRDKFWQAFQKVIHEKVDSDVEYRIVSPDGTVKHVYGLGHPVLNANGEIAEVVGTTVDITERKRAEEERARLQQLESDLAHINRVSMMGELTASIAHEVNQPLSGVVSNGSACLRWLAGDSPNLEEAQEAARRIVRDGKRAGEVIARIRALTKKVSTPREKLDLNETLRQVLALVGDEAKRKSVNVRTHFADNLYPVSGDQVRLQQVVLNLAMNAIEAMSSVGERTRELVITTRNTDADQVQVSVEDSGVGIDPQMVDKIFDSFYTTKPGGMGMGLSISRSILQTHGGRLWAVANGGPGTTFHFTLPRYEEGSNAAA